MKLQKVHSYNYGDKSHFKYLITLPESLINELKWESGSELEAKKLGDTIQILWISKPKKKEPKTQEPKITYEEFRKKIHDAMKRKPDGTTWAELREELSFDQVVPNNKWVRQLEKDIGLKRIRKTSGVIWTL